MRGVAIALLLSIGGSLVIACGNAPPPPTPAVDKHTQILLLWNQMEALDHVDLVDSGWRDLSSQTTPDRRATRA